MFFNKKKKEQLNTRLFNLIRKCIYNFYLNNNQSVLSTITNLNFENSKESLKIKITTHRPGLLIGKQGKFISNLASNLKNVFEKEIKIDIIESKLWENIYSKNL